MRYTNRPAHGQAPRTTPALLEKGSAAAPPSAPWRSRHENPEDRQRHLTREFGQFRSTSHPPQQPPATCRERRASSPQHARAWEGRQGHLTREFRQFDPGDPPRPKAAGRGRGGSLRQQTGGQEGHPSRARKLDHGKSPTLRGRRPQPGGWGASSHKDKSPGRLPTATEQEVLGPPRRGGERGGPDGPALGG